MRSLYWTTIEVYAFDCLDTKTRTNLLNTSM